MTRASRADLIAREARNQARALRVRTSLRAKRAMRPAREARGPPRGSPRPGRPHRRFAPIRLALGGGTPAEAKLINKFYARRRRDAA